MSEGLNRATLIGNLGEDPELKFTQSNQALLKLRLATTESYYDNTAKERKERTEWHNVVLWGNRAEALSKFLRKGSRVYIEGRIETRSYEKDGSKRYSTTINALKLILLSSSRKDSGAERSSDGDSGSYDHEPPPSGDNDIPF